MSTCEGCFSLCEHYFTNPNSGDVWKGIPKVVSKFHNDPTANESKIIVLLGHVLGLCRKRKNYNIKGVSLTSDIVSQIPTEECLEMNFELGAQISQRSND